MNKNTKKQTGKVPGSNPSSIGTQDNPVSDPQREASEPDIVEKELEARKRFLKEHNTKAKPGD